MEEPTRAKHPSDSTLGLIEGGLLRKCLVGGGVEGLAEGLNLTEPVAGEGARQLLDGEGKARGDGGTGLAIGASEAEAKRVDGGEEVLNDARGGELAEVGEVALVSASLVLMVGRGAQGGLAQLVDLDLEAGKGVLGGRTLRRG
jgi:hypothetical protein